MDIRHERPFWSIYPWYSCAGLTAWSTLSCIASSWPVSIAGTLS